MPHQRLKTTALCTGLKQGKECRSHRLMSRKETDMYLRATEGRVYFAQFRIKAVYPTQSYEQKKRCLSDFRAKQDRMYLGQFRIEDSCKSHSLGKNSKKRMQKDHTRSPYLGVVEHVNTQNGPAHTKT